MQRISVTQSKELTESFGAGLFGAALFANDTATGASGAATGKGHPWSTLPTEFPTGIDFQNAGGVTVWLRGRFCVLDNSHDLIIVALRVCQSAEQTETPDD